ncbi:Protein TALPID3 [Dissostichus eleginoides]|uniref:Protein TALPID3 n=1 Tax=Dissostichus eleginoides TaxID=100907 RepID=A0AAD9EMN1_DISEL|nr:Protein TALPID3 [Dissostichus eleginoides]
MTTRKGRIKLGRAHRSMAPKPGPEQRSRPIILKFHNFADKQLVMNAARKLGSEPGRLAHTGPRISFFNDYPAAVVKKRKAFDEIKYRLRKKSIDYALIYPETLKVMINGTERSLRRECSGRGGSAVGEEGSAVGGGGVQWERRGVQWERRSCSWREAPPPIRTSTRVQCSPPSVPPPSPPGRSLSSGLRLQRDGLEQRLVEWVEQQLMSRMISEMYRPPLTDPAYNLPMDQSECEEQSFTSDTGLQLCVVSGVPVDSVLVRQLVTEDSGPPLVLTPAPTPPLSPAPSSRETPPLTTPPPSEPTSILSPESPQPIIAPEPVATPPPAQSPPPRQEVLKPPPSRLRRC